MSVAAKHNQGLEWVLTVNIPAEEMKKNIDKKMRETAQRVRIDGFRPGKVPMQRVEQLYGEGIRAETVEQQMQNSLRDGLQQHKLRIAGTPKIDVKENGMHGALHFEATFEVYPKVTLDKLKEIKVKRYKAEITEADIDKALERVRKNFAEWEEVSRAAKEGDRVIIDFVGDMKEVPEAQRTGKDQRLVLGSKSMIPGFEDQIQGMKAGEEKTIKVTFPKEYHEKSLAGKPANFEITVKKVEEAKLPEIDEAFCKKLGITEGGVEVLRQRVRGEVEAHAERVARDKAKKLLLDQVLAKHNIELPKVFVKQEFDFLHNVRHGDHDHNHDHDHDHNHDHAHDHDHHHHHDHSMENEPELRGEAERKVALSLLLGEYVQENNIKADEQSMFMKALEIMRQQFGGNISPEMLQYVMKDENQQALIRSFVLEEKAVDKMLADDVEVEEETISVDKLITE